MSNLRQGWRKVSISDVAKVVTGKTPPTKKSGCYGGSIPFVTPGDLGKAKYVENSERQLTLEGAKHSPVIPAGSTLFTCIGIIGKVGFAGKGLRTNQQINSAIPKDIEPEFLYYALASSNKRIARIAGVQVVPIINKTEFENQIISIPESRSAQKTIANTLQTWDTAIEKTEALIVAKERQFRWFCTSVIREALPSGSPSMPLSHVYEFQKGAGLSKADITENGQNKCILYGQLYTTYGEAIDHVYSQTDLKNGVRSIAGDILIPGSTTTSAIDLANVTALLMDNVLLGGDINILRPKSRQANSEFMAYYLTHCKKHDLARLAQGITIIHLYGRDIKSIRISLPDLQTQNKIVTLLRAARREINLLKALAERYRAQKCGLMQKLLTGGGRWNYDY